MEIKKKHILMYAIIFLYFIIWLANYKILSLDEIWSFGFSKHIADGYLPYKDFNMVVTPLFFYIGALFSKSLMLFRIYAALIDSAVVFLAFRVFEKNKVPKQLSFILTISICFLLSIIAFGNYNIMLLLGLVILYILADRFADNANSANAFVFGFVLSLVLLVKQNVPAVLIVIFTIFFLYLVFSKRMRFSIFACYAAGVAAPAAAFAGFALKKGFLSDFIDYAFLGLHTFSHNRAEAAGFQSAYLIVAISAVFTVLIVLDFFKTCGNKKTRLAALVFSLSSYMLIYPITDLEHPITLLVLNVIFSSGVFKKMKLNLRYGKTVIGIYALLLLIISAEAVSLFDKNYVRSDLKYYSGICIDKALEKDAAEISGYIRENEKEGLDVAVIGKDAYFYNIPADDMNGILDLLLEGNTGTKTMGEIEAMIDKKDVILLEQPRQYDIQGIREHVLKNYAHRGEIGSMEIYIRSK